MKRKFDHLVIIGRPACGKSEFIDYMKNLAANELLEQFHIGQFKEIDDFPWIWEKFMEDDVWEKCGYPRKFSKEYMKGNPGLMPEGAALFDFCMEKFNEGIKANYMNNKGFYDNGTLFIEFSRGGVKNYGDQFPRLVPEIWEKAAIINIHVSREESWRRNVARYEEKLKHSILSHMVPKETYDYYYYENDWKDLTGGKESGYIEITGKKVPFVLMNNEPELPPGPEIAGRYKKALDTLFELYVKKA